VHDTRQDQELDMCSRRRLEGGRGADSVDGVVEVVVIPVAADPRRVWRIGEGGRRDTDEEGHEEQSENLFGEKHGI